MRKPQLVYIPTSVKPVIAVHLGTESFDQLAELLESSRIAAKEATDYSWDNSNFVVEDSYGRPALKLLCTEGALSFWSVHNGCAIGDITKDEWDTDKQAMRDRTKCS